ncbi:MAG: o-succinylbenzoate synthase [Odoribacteraceae bacterium]|jgi:o-succinylbenzoate synthase|nr:o-succinylbenzoate synthase [Odoribacteraceae bacterium]
MLKAIHAKRLFHFKEPAVTSRGVMTTRESWFVKVWEQGHPERHGVGECALFRGLSHEDRPGYEEHLAAACARVNDFRPGDWNEQSSICMGMETALADLQNGGNRQPFPSPFARGEREIEINGLVWMGNRVQMMQRAEEKLAAGFHCLKLKIGGVDFREELEILSDIRSRFPADRLQLRLDANGSFSPADAREKLERLALHDVHSIEQPLPPGMWRETRALAGESPVPVALDEELVGVTGRARKIELLDSIAPRYIVLKPSLAGGFDSCDEWISLAAARDIGWWVTSALESNIGLNAIAQWCAARAGELPAGLGTGQLYADNIPSPLVQRGNALAIDPRGSWDLQTLFPPSR